MRTDVERIRWAATFVGLELPKLRKREQLKLRTELGQFLGLTRKATSGGPAVVVGPASPWDYSFEQLLELQRAARQLLAGAVDTGPYRGGQAIEVSERIVLDVVHVSPGHRRLRIGGSVRASLLFNLAFLMAGEAGRDIRKCPECGRIFIRVRRQLYCSPKCTDRATWRNYPEEKKRRLREKQYAKQGWTLGARSQKKGKKR